MPIYKGTLKTGAAYKGSTSLSRIYKGAYLVFEAFKTLIAEGVPPITLLNCAAEIMLGYKIYGNSKQQLLPDGYTQLEYIRTTGTQYIDTGVAYDDTSIEVNFVGTIETNRTLFGIRKVSQTGYTFKISAANSVVRATVVADAYVSTLPIGATTIYNFVLGNVFKVDGDTLHTFNSSPTASNYNIYLFAENVIAADGDSSSAEDRASAKCYACKIYKNNVIIRNFVPCKNSSNILGLYDTVNNVFYTNAGTGTFTAGSTATVPNPDSPIEIESVGDNETGLPLGYTLLSYIEANSAQYLDTGFSPDGNTRVDYKVETTAGEFDASPFIGARVGNINTARFFPIAYNNVNGECRTAFGSKTGVIANVTAGTVLEGSFDPANGVSTINGTDYDISDASFQKTDNYNLYLFATPGYTGNLYLSHGKMYYCKIWDNGTLVRNFVPCKDTSNVVGMYDTVGKTFYSSETSTPLVAGDEIARGGYRIPVSVGSKNKYDISKSVLGGLSSSDGSESVSDARVRTNYIEIDSSYSISMDTTLPYKILNAYFYDSNKNYVGVQQIANTSQQPVKNYSNTKLSGSTYMRVVFYSTVSSSTVIDLPTFKQSKIQIEEGSTATAYEEYFNRTENIYLDEPLRKLGNADAVNLPSGYTQLEYIATPSSDTVNAYIDTGLYANPNLRVNTEVEFIAVKGQASLFRSGADFWAGVYLAGNLKFAYTYQDDAGNYTTTGITAANGTRYNIDFDGKQRTLKINNNTITISGSPATKTSTKTLPLLGRIGGDGTSVYSDFYGKLYYAKIYDNGTLVRNFIPAKNSSNVIGMYDTVNNVFYTNAGTGSFTAGPAVYADYLDFETGKVVRKINYNEFTSLYNEIARYSNYSRYGANQFSPRNVISLGVEKCNYLQYRQAPNGLFVGGNTGASFYLYDEVTGVTAEDDTGAKRTAKAVAWLRSLSPRLRVYYVLETETEETVTLPDILLNKGTNIISVGTSVQPSNMWIKYKGRR